MGIVAWIVIGAIIGWIETVASKINIKTVVVGNIISGISGALLGGWFLALVKVIDKPLKIEGAGLVAAVFGALTVIFVVKIVKNTN